jgi:hypothetical protein
VGWAAELWSGPDLTATYGICVTGHTRRKSLVAYHRY